jgi:hypothetical protein
MGKRIKLFSELGRVRWDLLSEPLVRLACDRAKNELCRTGRYSALAYAREIVRIIAEFLKRVETGEANKLRELFVRLGVLLDALEECAEAMQKFSTYLTTNLGRSESSLAFSRAYGGRLAGARKHINKEHSRNGHLTGEPREPGTGNDIRSFPGVTYPVPFTPFEVFPRGPSRTHNREYSTAA